MVKDVKGIKPISTPKPPSSLKQSSALKPSSTPKPDHKVGYHRWDAASIAYVPIYIAAILDPQNKQFRRLECPTPKPGRYEYLRPTTELLDPSKPKYFIAINLHQVAHLLPRLIGSIIETILFLGPSSCTLSIVEGRSTDGTYEILSLLKPVLSDLGISYFLNSSSLDPTATDRILALAELRNAALEPLTSHPENYDKETTVVFLNDVAICMEDILELIHQRQFQKADMTCAMDWVNSKENPTFYDVWIGRTISGNSFFPFPEDGSWEYSSQLFRDDLKTRRRFEKGRSFQVFACWNGAVTFTAKPLMEGKIRFRTKKENECFQGEPNIFCKEMWSLGYGKIAVVPTVNLEYSDELGQMIKEMKGWVGEWVAGLKTTDVEEIQESITWLKKPPGLVKCMKTWDDQLWLPWNEGLQK
ncbi:hypothetical protein B7494_g8418 [Chlorociboria aeruginascens]|nr:hypothetical protein B7494_g8418 [Chlorociboria aeruginascens]